MQGNSVRWRKAGLGQVAAGGSCRMDVTGRAGAKRLCPVVDSWTSGGKPFGLETNFPSWIDGHE